MESLLMKRTVGLLLGSVLTLAVACGSSGSSKTDAFSSGNGNNKNDETSIPGIKKPPEVLQDGGMSGRPGTGGGSGSMLPLAPDGGFSADAPANMGTSTDGPRPATADGPPRGDALAPAATCMPACPQGQTCDTRVGQCVALCDSTLTRCANTCVDLSSDPKFCGACNAQCPATQFCSRGKCVTACANGETKCAASCVNLQNSYSNCGSCGTKCKGSQVCASSQCKCAAPNLVCDGVCVSVANNRDNCGACGNRCQGDLVCNGTSCGCPGGRSRCPNNGNRCVADLNECCAVGQALCNGACIDVQADTNNCGRCDRQCGGVQVCSGAACRCPAAQPRACSNGVCLPNDQCCTGQTKCGDGSCVNAGQCCPGLTLCPGTANKCVPTLAECCAGQFHCGAGRCAPTAGACCDTGTYFCGGTCKECCDDVQCASDGSKICTANKCVCKLTCPGSGKCVADFKDCCGTGQRWCMAKMACITDAAGTCCSDVDCNTTDVNRACTAATSTCGCKSGTTLCPAGTPGVGKCQASLTDCCATGNVWCPVATACVPMGQCCDTGKTWCAAQNACATVCCPDDKTLCGATCIPKVGSCCADVDCADMTKKCDTGASPPACACKVTCPGGACAATMAGCCPTGQELCGTGCVAAGQCCTAAQKWCPSAAKCVATAAACCTQDSCVAGDPSSSCGTTGACSCSANHSVCPVGSTNAGKCAPDANRNACCGGGNKLCNNSACKECCGDSDCNDPTKPKCSNAGVCVAAVVVLPPVVP